MERVDELRNRAALCRRVAAVPTSGSARADRVLMLLAEALDREASIAERGIAAGRRVRAEAQPAG